MNFIKNHMAQYSLPNVSVYSIYLVGFLLVGLVVVSILNGTISIKI